MAGKAVNEEAFKIVYFAVLSVTVLLTFFLFSVIFLFNAEPAEGEDEINKGNDIVQNDNEVSENAQEILNLENQIAAYDEVLSNKYLLLVNNNNPLPEDFEQTALLTSESNPAVSLEALTKVKIEEFIAAAKEEGYTVKVTVGYRSNSEQESVYNQEIQSLMNAGYTREMAETKAALVCAKPGYSEFETGYTVEIAETSNMTKDEMENSDLYKYIKENIYKYGFIQRYPQGKEAVTEYDYNPFCYRYVGDVGVAEGIVEMPHAQYMYEKNLTLEEYLGYLKNKRAEAVQALSVLKGGK